MYAHEAPFSSLLSRNGSCLPWQDILGLKVDGMDQATAYRQIHMYSTVRPRDGVRACKNTVRCPDDCPFQCHRHDVPEVEFKKKTPILATLRDFSKACPA